VKAGSLFSGYGGLDLAVEAIFGARTAWHCEINGAAARLLAHRHPGTPNHADITATDWSTVEPVDILAGGWPCQPFSLAGKRRGAADERALWPHVAAAVRVLRPRYVVLENVAAVLASPEFDRVATDLATLGYDLTWTCLRASDVGATHRRNRLFIVACHAKDFGHERLGCPRLGRARSTDPDLNAADSNGPGSQGTEPTSGRHLPDRGTAADTDRDGLARLGRELTDRRDPDGRDRADTAWGPYEPAIRRWERVLGRSAPAPTEPNTRGGQRLSPRFVEWMMGLPDGWVTDVPGISRNDQLKMLGNGCVPQQATAAISSLVAA
jgi:DNA (cytosine-5)-methyltransferase 1